MASFTPQEIEQFLQEFFDVVGARQYVGARYVPIFGRAGEDTVEWDDTAPYEPLTVVMHDGVSYVSRRYVPAGIDVADTGYWVQTYRFNAQVEQYRQEVLTFQGQIDDRIPFPDPDFYPKYGTAGQVLETLTDGTVKWTDPVVPSDEQAEEVISAWLEAHPEATTTVQDGAITDAKMATAPNQFFATALRATTTTITPSNSTAEQRDFNALGTGYRNNSVLRFANFTTANPLSNAPSPTFAGTLVSLGLTGDNTFGTQLAISESSPFTVYYRFFKPDTASTHAWGVLGDKGSLSIQDIYEATRRSLASLLPVIQPSNVTADLSDLNNVGSSGFRNNSIVRYANFNANNAVAHAPITPFNGFVVSMSVDNDSNYSVQLAIEQANSPRMWWRFVISGTPATFGWTQVADTATLDRAIQVFPTNITPSTLTTPYADLNNTGNGIDNNMIYRYASFTSSSETQIQNAPITPFNGYFVTFAPTRDSRFGVQFAFEQSYPFRIWNRFFVWGTASTWKWRRIPDEGAYYEVSTAQELFALLRTNPRGTINLAPGTYDLYTGLVEPLVLDDSYTQVFLSSDITIYGNGSIINLEIPEAVALAHTATCNNVAAFDLLGSAHLHDLTINCRNTRYAVHYEAMTSTQAYDARVSFDNCELNYVRDDVPGLNAYVVGIGGNKGQQFDFRHCVLNSTNGSGIYIHGRTYTMGHLNIDDCIITVTGSYGLNLSQYTGQTMPVDVFVSCSRVGNVYFVTQSGGNTNNQYRGRFVNSDVNVTVDPNTTLLYPYTTIETIGA